MILILATLSVVSTTSNAFVIHPTRQLRNHHVVFEPRYIHHNYCYRKPSAMLLASQSKSSQHEEEDDPDAVNPDIVWPDEDEDDDLVDWVPDRVKAKVQRLESRIHAEKETQPLSTDDATIDDPATTDRPSPYTEEEEDVIAAMGGKTLNKRRQREIGYLGDSTLREIAMDYSVPISYLADVLCMWGVLPPIQIDDVSLGDMVTGEQAFALLEAANSLDVGALNDRYSNTNLRQLSYEFDIDLQDAFSMVMKEGWSLPFGVETCLRVEQEDELIRVLRHDGSGMTSEALDFDEEDYEYGDPY